MAAEEKGAVVYVESKFFLVAMKFWCSPGQEQKNGGVYTRQKFPSRTPRQVPGPRAVRRIASEWQ